MDYLEIIRQAEEAHQPNGSMNATGGETSRCFQPSFVKPGNRITWGADGLQRGPATVDFLHTDPDGTMWAFVTLPAGWAAVNTTYVTKTEGGNTP